MKDMSLHKILPQNPKRRTFQEVCDDAKRVEQFCLDYINGTKYDRWVEFVFMTLWINLDHEITGEVMQ